MANLLEDFSASIQSGVTYVGTQTKPLSDGAKKIANEYVAWAAKNPTVKTMNDFFQETGKGLSEDAKEAATYFSNSNTGKAIYSVAGKTWEAAKTASSTAGDFFSKNAFGLGAGVVGALLLGLLTENPLIGLIGGLIAAAVTSFATGGLVASWFEPAVTPSRLPTAGEIQQAAEAAKGPVQKIGSALQTAEKSGVNSAIKLISPVAGIATSLGAAASKMADSIQKQQQLKDEPQGPQLIDPNAGKAPGGVIPPADAAKTPSTSPKLAEAPLPKRKPAPGGPLPDDFASTVGENKPAKMSYEQLNEWAEKRQAFDMVVEGGKAGDERENIFRNFKPASWLIRAKFSEDGNTATLDDHIRIVLSDGTTQDMHVKGSFSGLKDKTITFNGTIDNELKWKGQIKDVPDGMVEGLKQAQKQAQLFDAMQTFQGVANTTQQLGPLAINSIVQGGIGAIAHPSLIGIAAQAANHIVSVREESNASRPPEPINNSTNPAPKANAPAQDMTNMAFKQLNDLITYDARPADPANEPAGPKVKMGFRDTLASIDSDTLATFAKHAPAFAVSPVKGLINSGVDFLPKLKADAKGPTHD